MIDFLISSFFHDPVGREDVQQTGLLPAGAEQDGVGGSGAVPEPDAGGLRSLRLGVVSACARVCVCARGGARLHRLHDLKVRFKATLWVLLSPLPVDWSPQNRDSRVVKGLINEHPAALRDRHPPICREGNPQDKNTASGPKI